MKLITTILLSIGLVFAIGCGKEGDDKGGDKGAAAAKASPAMTAFMSDLKGKSADVTTALKTHGAEGLDNKDMDMYDLESPKVIKVDGDCETMEAKSGMTVRTYIVCWKDSKIATIEDKGMK